jgi:hypothetical protein
MSSRRERGRHRARLGRRALTEATEHRPGGGGGASRWFSVSGDEVRSSGLHELEGVKGWAPGNKVGQLGSPRGGTS